MVGPSRAAANRAHGKPAEPADAAGFGAQAVVRTTRTQKYEASLTIAVILGKKGLIVDLVRSWQGVERAKATDPYKPRSDDREDPASGRLEHTLALVLAAGPPDSSLFESFLASGGAQA